MIPSGIAMLWRFGHRAAGFAALLPPYSGYEAAVVGGGFSRDAFLSETRFARFMVAAIVCVISVAIVALQEILNKCFR